MEWYVFALASAFFFTFFQVLRKEALQKSHAMNFESVRIFFVVIFALFVLPFTDWSFDKSSLVVAYIVSLLATVGILYASRAYRHKDLSLISPLATLRPAFIAVLAAIFLGESLGVKEILGISIILISAYVLESNHHFSNLIAPLKHILKSKYSLYFIFASFLFSICSVLDKYMIGHKITNIYTYYFIIWLFIAINFNIIHFFMYGIKDSVKCIKKTKSLPILVAFFSVLSNLLFLKSLSMAYVSLVMPIHMSSILLIVLFGGKFFHEKHLIFRLLTSAFMILGVYLIII